MSSANLTKPQTIFDSAEKPALTSGNTILAIMLPNQFIFPPFYIFIHS